MLKNSCLRLVENDTLWNSFVIYKKYLDNAHLVGFNLDSKNTFSASFSPFDSDKITFEDNEKMIVSLLK